MRKLNVRGILVAVTSNQGADFISLTDIARAKNPEFPADIVKNWMRTRFTIEFMGLWEQMHNPDFKLVDFDQFKHEAGSNSFAMSPEKWIKCTRAIGIRSKSGRGGGTFAHSDIAYEFASWVSAEFKLYLIKEFQRLKIDEQKRIDSEWDVKRQLTKLNYRIHTDAIKRNLVPDTLTSKQINLIYASEADVLNMALLGKTAKQWRDENPKQEGNIRDYCDVMQLVVLANLEGINADLINRKIDQSTRLTHLNQTAIIQMKSLLNDPSVKKLQS